MMNHRDASLVSQFETSVSKNIRPNQEFFHDGMRQSLDAFLNQVQASDPARIARLRESLAALDSKITNRGRSEAPAKVDPFAVTVDPAMEALWGVGLLLRLARTLRNGGAIPGRIVSDGEILTLTRALEAFRGHNGREPDIAAVLGLASDTPLPALAASVLGDLRNRGLVPKEEPHPAAVRPYAGVQHIGPTKAELERLASGR